MKVNISKKFVGGNLKGITYKDSLSYPKSSQSRVAKEMVSAILSGKVFEGFGSPYVIVAFDIEGTNLAMSVI